MNSIGIVWNVVWVSAILMATQGTAGAAEGGSDVAGQSLSAGVEDALVPDTDEILGWIETVFNQGIRRPGYPADEWTENWAKKRFEEFGLKDVRLEDVELLTWQDKTASLEVWSESRPGDVLTLPGFPIPYAASTDGTEGELVASTKEAEGNILAKEIRLLTLPSSLRAFATRVYDPEGEFDNLKHTMPFSPAIQDTMEVAIKAGARAFVGMLIGFPWDTQNYYVPYDARPRSIPGLYLSKTHSEALLAKMAGGPVRVKLVAQSETKTVTSHNVIGVLPGASEEWIIIGSHHDGPWASAVEDASGVSLVLAQAKYWSRIPAGQRPHNLMFLLNAGHMAGGAGARSFIATHKDFLEKVVLEIHLEHTARESRGENGRLVVTENPEVRWWWTSRIDYLEDLVAAALNREKLGRSLVLPPGALFDRPPTDGGAFHVAGVPLVNFLAAPMYLFDSRDTMDKIHEESLEPITRATIHIINGMAGQTARGMRNAVRPPAD